MEVKSNYAPRNILITQKVYRTLYPNIPPKRMSVKFTKNKDWTDVDEKLGKYLIEKVENIKEYDPYEYMSPVEAVENIIGDHNLRSLGKFKAINKLAKKFGLWKYGMKTAKMIKLIKEYEANDGKNTR